MVRVRVRIRVSDPQGHIKAPDCVTYPSPQGQTITLTEPYSSNCMSDVDAVEHLLFINFFYLSVLIAQENANYEKPFFSVI